MSTSPLFRRKPFGLILKDTEEGAAGQGGLRRSLNVFDLTALGIAAVIGAGIFSTIGTAAATGGGPPSRSSFCLHRRSLRFLGPLLCTVRFRDPRQRQRLHIRLCQFRRTDRMDHRVGPDHGICHRQYRGGHLLVAIISPGWLGGIGLDIPAYLQVDYLTAARGYQCCPRQTCRRGIPH